MHATLNMLNQLTIHYSCLSTEIATQIQNQHRKLLMTKLNPKYTSMCFLCYFYQWSIRRTQILFTLLLLFGKSYTVFLANSTAK